MFDFYENFNNDISITNHYHEYCLNLESDIDGNFYFIKGGNLSKATVPHHGCLVKVSNRGQKLEVIATGHRAPNGMSVGPNGEITSADNEGNWVPTSRINLVKRGGFYGHVHTAHGDQVPSDFERPLLWLPHQLDNSSGGQIWVTSDRWGPFKGDLLHLSYGRCQMFKIMREEVNGQAQGGAVHFPRTDSAVIVLVHDGDDCLLCRQSHWPTGMHSTLAGFLEPGESLEETVAREIFEESGVPVSDVRYHSSQPWPFPASIMVGFMAKAESREITVNDKELEYAHWYGRDWLRNVVDSDAFRMPGKYSIARRLIGDWIEGRFPV